MGLLAWKEEKVQVLIAGALKAIIKKHENDFKRSLKNWHQKK